MTEIYTKLWEIEDKGIKRGRRRGDRWKGRIGGEGTESRGREREEYREMEEGIERDNDWGKERITMEWMETVIMERGSLMK